jgi:hypothetical protein
MPLKNPKRKDSGVPVEDTFDFFLLIGGSLEHTVSGLANAR